MGKNKSKRSSRSSCSPGDSSGGESEREKRKLKKLKKKLKKEQRKAEKVLKKKLKEEKKKLKGEARSKQKVKTVTTETASSADIPLELMERSKKMAPMTKEEWDKRQSIVRKVLDEETGRYRLIKGDGEVLEEIVSKEHHKQINKHATRSDGEFFQSQTIGKKQF